MPCSREVIGSTQAGKTTTDNSKRRKDFRHFRIRSLQDDGEGHLNA
jgi:hypothetical protein